MITVDAKELMKLNEGFRKYQNAIPKSVAVKALRDSVKPMLMSAQRLVPSTNTGATRRDLRIRFVKEEGTEIARVLVGVSAKKGKVGWRTHFITRGWTDRGGYKHRGRDFLQDAHDYTIDVVQEKFFKALFDGFVKWGKENLPQ